MAAPLPVLEFDAPPRYGQQVDHAGRRWRVSCVMPARAALTASTVPEGTEPATVADFAYVAWRLSGAAR